MSKLQIPITELIELYTKREKFNRMKKKYEKLNIELQNKIIEYMKQEGSNELEIEPSMLNGSVIKAKRITSKKIVFDVEKLKKKIDKELLNEFVTKTYTISDFEGLKDLLKSHGVSSKEFKQYLSIDEKVDQDKINQLSEIGDIKESDIEGCYTVYENEGYIKFVTEK